MRDATHAARRLLRTPGYTLAIVLTLALGIGATTMIYSVVHGVLIRPLPFPDQERLVMLWQRAPGVGVGEDWFSPAQYFDLREVSSFEDLAIFTGLEATLGGAAGGEDAAPEPIGALFASSSLFRVLGVDVALGRPLLAGDDTPGPEQKVVLTDRLFARRFGRDPAVVGSTVTIEGEPFEVVGVLPPLELERDAFPTLQVIRSFDLISSLPIADPQVTRYGSENFNVVGKLRVGATIEQLEAELGVVAAAFTEDPESLGAGLEPGAGYRIGVVPLLDQVVGNAGPRLLILLGATGLLLAIACVNVANLMLTRAASNSRRIAICRALGASRVRIFGQSMLESFALAAAGGVVGFGIARLGVRTLHAVAPADLPRLQAVAVDEHMLLFAFALCVGSSILFGNAPALRNARVDPEEVLSESGPARPSESIRRRRGTSYLVTLQIALSVMLLVGTCLLGRTLLQLQAVDPGFEPEGLLSLRLGLAGAKYNADPSARVAFFDELTTKVSGVRGVVRTGGMTLLPMDGMYSWTDFGVEGHVGPETPNPDDRMVADSQLVTPGYFETLGIPLLAGRSFELLDGADPLVAVVDRTFAERFWTADEAVGKWIVAYPLEMRATIVGVVDTMRHYGLASAPRPSVYFPYRFNPIQNLYLGIRVDGDPLEVAAVVRDTVGRLDPDLAVSELRSIADIVDASVSRQRLSAQLLTLFSAVALTLATVGLYGVLAFAVATHGHELGVRMALGARRRDLYLLVLRRARLVTFAGIAIGSIAAFAVKGLFDELVYGVSTADPISFLVAALFVGAVAFVASYLPARRAASIDPIGALKGY